MLGLTHQSMTAMAIPDLYATWNATTAMYSANRWYSCNVKGEGVMTKKIVAGKGSILIDNHGHKECNGECKGSIHTIYKRP